MKHFFFAPLLWGIFLFDISSGASPLPQLRSSLPARLAAGHLTAPAAAVHARILAIRVAFQPDTIATTTGTGAFNSGIPDTVKVDPTPHNRAYFEDHLRFLGNYFAEVSDSLVTVDAFAVFPAGSDSAYLLPNQMWHYNHNTTPEDLNMRLAWLFRDAWQAADSDTAIHPENFNTFIIFHAGVGKDFQLNFDETPHDLPSAYFTLPDLQESLGDTSFQGVLVNGTLVSEGLLLPECEFQPEVGVEIAMNGTETLLFAHSLGLPALYNTEDGSSGVGSFDIMDQGSGNFAGMVPARPCAWSRAFMGWEEPITIQPGAQADTFWVNVHGYGDPGDPVQHQIYRVNLNEYEYYLIENRNYDPDSLGYTIAHDAQGRQMKINKNYDVELLQGDFGVIVSVDNYDFGIPGRGILIWHIDESVIQAKYADNQINNDLSHRGVDLVEADGAQDIGQSYGFFDIGYGTELGWSRDFFFAGNEEFQAANPQLGTIILFYDDSHPGTRTHDNSPTGLRMDGFNAPVKVMRFWVQNSWAQQGFPRQLADSAGNLSPAAIDFDDDGKTDWILTFTPEGAIQAFDSLGRAQGSLHDSSWQVDLLGNDTLRVDTLLARVDSITATPAVDTLSKSIYDLKAIIPSSSGKVFILSYAHGFGTAVINLDSVQLTASTACTPLILDLGDSSRWFIGDGSGYLSAFNEDDALQWRVNPFPNEAIIGLCLSDASDTASIFILSNAGGMALVDQFGGNRWNLKHLPFIPSFAPISLYHQNDSSDLVAVGSGGEVALLDPATGDYRPGFHFNVGMTITAPPAAADFDRDGRLELILAGVNRIVGIAENGVLVANWPMTLDARWPNEPIQSPPTISELGFDGELRVFFGWPGGSVDARDRWGDQAEGFTRSTGSMVRSAPLLVQLDGDDETELVALDESGALHCWHLEQLGNFDGQRRPWNGLQNGNLRQGLALDSVSATPPDQSILVKTKVYPWPNPAPNPAAAGDASSHIRYLMGQSGRISVRIFDGAGDLVKELSGQAEAGIEADLEWDLSDVTSGVYIGRVEAEADGKTEKTFIKIAVVK